jgi:hypothetical protein
MEAGGTGLQRSLGMVWLEKTQGLEMHSFTPNVVPGAALPQPWLSRVGGYITIFLTFYYQNMY